MKENIINNIDKKFYSLGSLAISKIYNNLRIREFLNSFPGFDNKVSNIFKYLIYSKIFLKPKINYFDDINFLNKNEILDCINKISLINEDIISFINTRISDLYNRDTSTITCLQTNDSLILVDNDEIPLYYMEKTETTIDDIEELISEFELIYEINNIKIIDSPSYINDIFNLSNDLKGNLLINYVTLVILNLLKFKLSKKYKLDIIINSLNNSILSFENKGVYNNIYKDEILEELQIIFNIPFTKKLFTNADISTIVKEINNY